MSNGKFLTVDGITFDHGDYDAAVLYLHRRAAP